MATTKATTKPPLVLWAQRANKLFLTLEIEDCKEPIIKLEKDQLYFRGKSDSISRDADHTEHEVTIQFCKPINVEESKHSVKARGIEFVVIKEEEGWWPRLLKDSTKQHWLKIDFPKWKDEDDTDDEAAGGLGGMPGMGGMGGMGGMDGQPDFSQFMQQFGNMSGGAGDMGAFGGEGSDEEEDEDDEEEGEPPKLADN